MSNLTNDGQKQTLEVYLRGVTKPTQLYLGLASGSYTKASVLADAYAGESLGAATAPAAAVAALAGLGAGNLSAGAYSYKVTFVTPDGETNSGAVSNTVTVVNPATDGQVSLSAIPTGPASVTSRKIYRTTAGGGTWFLLATLADNVTTTYTDNIADGSLGVAAPSVNSTGQKIAPNSPSVALAGVAGALSAGVYKYAVSFVTATGETEPSSTASVTVVTPGTNGQVNVTSIPIGPAGVTARKVWRTLANGSQLKQLTTIADNSTTSYVDNTADGGLGVDSPRENTTAPNGYRRLAIDQNATDWATSALDAGDWQLISKVFQWGAVGGTVGPVTIAFLCDKASGSTGGLLLAFWDLSAAITLLDTETLDFTAYIKQK